MVAMFVNGLVLNEQSLQRIVHRCILASVGSFGQAVSEENIFFLNSTNQKQELPVEAMFVNGSGRNGQSLQNRGHSIDASYQVSVHLTKWFQRGNRSIRNSNCLRQQCLLTDRDKMCTLYREHSIDVSYQVSFHLARWFQRR